MNVELADDLGYSEYDYKNKTAVNSCNGTYFKTVNRFRSAIEPQVSRDWEGNYASRIV